MLVVHGFTVTVIHIPQSFFRPFLIRVKDQRSIQIHDCTVQVFFDIRRVAAAVIISGIFRVKYDRVDVVHDGFVVIMLFIKIHSTSGAIITRIIPGQSI